MLTLLLAFSALAAAAPTRVPWLVDDGSTTARVCWRLEGADHCRAFEGLSPGATFTYTTPVSTQTFAAKTLPPEGSPLRFAVFGDMGKGTRGQFEVGALLDKLDPDLVLVAGDVVYPKGADADYDANYFQPYAKTLPRRCFFPALGNHDYGATHDAAKGERAYETGYRRVFERPKYYSFDAGPAHFVVLDTNSAYKIGAAAPIGPGSAQLRWLEQDLSRNTRPWVFALMHVPLYSTQWSHGDNAFLREALGPIFERRKVAAVFAGHDHIYQRSKREKGVVYVTVGTGGGGLNWGGLRKPWLEEEEETYGLLLGELDRETLRLRFYDETGAVRDETTLKRP